MTRTMIPLSCRMDKETLTNLYQVSQKTTLLYSRHNAYPITIDMAIFREYIAPFLVVLVFLIALVAVSARIFLPTDMAAPAPIEEVNPQPKQAQALPTDREHSVLAN